jgi:outer membrane protein assembly factor BamD (BamD/ComL family)
MKKKNSVHVLNAFLLVFSILITGCASTSSTNATGPGKRQMSETWSQANKAYANKEWSRAQKLFGELTEHFPEDSEALFRLGVSAYRDGNNRLAEESFEKVIRLEPENVKATYNLGIMELANAYRLMMQCARNASTSAERRKYKRLAEKIAAIQ